MFIQETTQYLQIIDHGLMNVLLPQLQDEQARAVAQILHGAVLELHKREVRTPGMLAGTNREGLAIAGELQALIATCADANGADDRELRDIAAQLASAGAPAFASARDINNRLNRSIEASVKRLSALRGPGMSAELRSASAALLRRAADWDYGCSTAQRAPIEFAGFDLGIPPQGQDINLDNLQRFVDRQRPGAGIRVDNLKKIPGGMGKHTYGCTFVLPDGRREDVIIRKEAPDSIWDRGAWRIAAEYLLLEAVADAGYNVARPLMLAQGDPAFDADFFIMERRPGIVPGNFFGPLIEMREELLLDLAAHMAWLHSIPIETFGAYIGRYLSPDILSGDIRTAYRVELEYWKTYTAENKLPESPALAYAADWLIENIPDNRERPVLVHGDMNIHNFLVEDNRISAVLDWEMALPGDPAQDIAYVKPNIEKYIDWDKFMNHYYQSGGRPIDESSFAYYIAFANYRPLIGSLRNMALFRDRQLDDVRLPYIDTEFVPQFTHNILANIR